ncbi:methionyl-tRNA synthetase [candidate division WOR_3 bacterium SM23_42]|uniref:Methionine--tRNA ligase n=1 Tax=candidate division WOR_3 bacterium SM23_42 TaxID=1703779 RepID=A0A0S8FR89_UNCW3|nr:MAG: methionyl-tRNA synthetase [candidate division WOR_3 bacterium SM23_42]
MKILVTSALPYANGDIHLGHLAGAYLPADIYVRYQRLKRRDVVYICGTDEHGVPVTISAEKQKKTPREIVDQYYASIKKSFEDFGMTFDNFSRTSLPIHHRLAQDFFLKINEKGFIYPREVEQFYCTRCKRFLPDRYITGTCPKCNNEGARGDQCESCGHWLEPSELIQPRCLVCGETPKKTRTKHWYFRLSQFQDKLSSWIADKKEWKETVLTFVQGWLREGLQDRPITRDLSWGVPVPLDDAEDKVLYVWFDAPIGYISSTIEWAQRQGKPDLWRDYWLSKDTKLVHFIGKDNIVFHALIWPAMLMAYGDYVLPSEIPANQFLNLEGGKFSTSKDYAIWLPDYLKEFKADSLRYALTRNAPEARDTDFTWRDFQAWHNNELADILGNFVNRTLTFIKKYYNSSVPSTSFFAERDNYILDLLKKAPHAVGDRLERFEFKGGLQELMKIAQEANRYFDHEEPWSTRKKDPAACARTMCICMKIVTALSVLTEPFLPFTAQRIKKMINAVPQSWDDIGRPELATAVGEPVILFEKITDEIIKAQVEKLKKESVDLEYFSRINLKTAKVLTAERVEGTANLIKCGIEVGDQRKQIVAGVGKDYAPEELVGKTIVIVDNLVPVKIRGVLSEGMLLAAVDKKGIVLITADRPASSGTAVQ